MGQLVWMNQPARVSRAPMWRLSGAEFGILGSSKGSGWERGGVATPQPAPQPGPTAVMPTTSSVLDNFNNPSLGASGPVRITAGGDVLPSSKPRIITRPAPPAPPPTMHPIGGTGWNPLAHPGQFPPLWWWSSPSTIVPDQTPTVAPAPPMPGGGGGAGAPGATQDDAAPDPAVFLGLTQKQLLIGGGLAVAAYLLLRKKGSAAAAPASDAMGGL